MRKVIQVENEHGRLEYGYPENARERPMVIVTFNREYRGGGQRTLTFDTTDELLGLAGVVGKWVNKLKDEIEEAGL